MKLPYPKPGIHLRNVLTGMAASSLVFAACLIGKPTMVGQINEYTSEIPAHKPVNLPGLHAYAQKSIAAGEEIEFRVSSNVPYTLSLVQLGPDPENRDDDPVLESVQVETPQAQPIHPGSYVHVPDGLPNETQMTEFTFEGWIRPFSLKGSQGLITQHDFPERSGIGLIINEGRIAFITGTGKKHDSASLHQTEPGLIRVQTWHHIVASWDGKTKRIYVDGKLVAEYPFAGMVRPGPSALRLGASGSEGITSNFYNGDLAMCAIYDKALNEEQIQLRFADQGLTTPSEVSLIACWPFYRRAWHASG